MSPLDICQLPTASPSLRLLALQWLANWRQWCHRRGLGTSNIRGASGGSAMRLAVSLLVNEYRRSWWLDARQQLLIISVLAFLGWLWLLPDAHTWFRETPYRFAEYDFWLNTPGALHTDIAWWKERPEVAEAVGVSAIGGGEISSPRGRARATALLTPSIAEAGSLLPINESLLSEGAFVTHGAILSRRLADRLGVGVGDWVELSLEDVRIGWRVVGIVYATARGQEMLAELGPDEAVQLSQVLRDGIIMSQVYVRLHDGILDAETAQALATAFARDHAERVSTPMPPVLRQQELDNQRQFAAAFTEQSTYHLIRWAAAVAYLLLAIRDSLARFARHRRLYDTLQALGASRGGVLFHYLLESSSLLVVSVIVAIVLASFGYERILNFYLPQSLVWVLALTILIAGLCATVMSALLIVWRGSRLRAFSRTTRG